MKKHVTNIPKRRFKGFTDAWEQRKLGDVLRFQNGFNGGREAYGAGTAFISVMDILNNQFITYDCIRGKATVTDDEIERFSVRYGDVLFQRSSENVEDAGTSNVYVDNDKTAIFGGFVIRGRQIAPYSPRFMKYLLDTKTIRKQITKKAQGAQHVNVSQETLQDIQITLPNQREQEAIENCLCNLDNLIILHQRKCDSLKQVKKYMLQKMFPKQGEKVPEIRFAGFTGDWEQRKLGDIGETYTGLSGKTKEDFGHGDARFVTYMNVFSNPVADKDKVEAVEIDYSQNEVQYGDVFFTTSSETPEEVGMSSVWLESMENTYLNSFCFGYRPKTVINPYFMAYVLRSDEVRAKIIFLAQGISRYNISKNKVMEIEILFPDIKEQKKIGTYFFTLDNLITLHQRKSDSLKEIKKFMLQNMFPNK